MLHITRRRTSEHERTREDLSAYLDNQLSQADRSRVDQHLEGCSECRAELGSLQRTVALLHALPAARLPRSFLLPVSAAPVRRVQPSRVSYGFLRAATAVASVLLVLVVSGDALLHLQSTRLAALPATGRGGGLDIAPEATAELMLAAAAPSPSAELAPEVMPGAPPAPSDASAARSTEAVALGAPPGPSASAPGPPSPGLAESTASAQAAPALEAPAAADQTPRAETAPDAPPTSMAKSAADQTVVATPALPAAEATLPLPTASPAPVSVAPAAKPDEEGPAERSDLPIVQPSGSQAVAERLGRYLQWVERGLAASVALLLGATLWQRRRAR